MTTVINNPGEGSGSGAGMVIGVLVAIILVVLFFVYGWPAMRGAPAADNGSLDVNVTLPSGGDSSGSGSATE